MISKSTRQTLRLATCLLAGFLGCLNLASCKPMRKASPTAEPTKSPEPAKPSQPFITATPNPIRDGTGPQKTTVSWDTGDGMEGEVYVSVNDGAEKPFGKNPQQSLEASWINSGDICVFRLYKGLDHKDILAAVTVTRPKADGSMNSTGRPLIIATPNPVPPGDGNGVTKVFWNTGDGSMGEVYVSINGEDEKPFGKNTSQSLDVPWIQTGNTYEFRLYREGDRKTSLGSVKVTR